MSKPESILTDAEMHALISGNPFTLGLSVARLKDFIRQVEKVVVAKLAEQEPVAWRVWLKDLKTWSYSSTYHGCGEQLSAFSWCGHYDNSDHIPDAGNMINSVELTLKLDTKEIRELLKTEMKKAISE